MKAGFQEVVKQSKKLEQKLDDHQTRITQLEEDSTFLPPLRTMERREQGTPKEARPLIDLDAISKHLSMVATHYERTAPTVSHWADTLFMTMQEDVGNVTLREIITASALLEEGQWEQPNFAANRIDKLMENMHKDTTGYAGF